MHNLIAIGDAVVDTHVQIDDASIECDINRAHCKLCLDYAAKVPVTGSFQSLGGNAANVAAGVKKLGMSSAILSSLGKDSNGNFIRRELKKFGVDTGLLGVDPKIQTRYGIALTYKGERTILSYYAKRKYSWPPKMPACSWIYYSSLSEGFESLQEKLFAHLDRHPTVKLAINPGSFQIKNALQAVREAVGRADLLFVNLEEAEKIAGQTLSQAKSAPALIHSLLQMGAKEVALTDAGRGAWAGDNDEIWHLDAYPVRVATKTGAGDAFSSGYLSARFFGHDIAHALEWGVVNSCAVIAQLGAQNGLLDQKGIKKMIAKFPAIKPAVVSPFAVQA